jgi:anaerobic ribonucleoside-triphosphate reductase
VERKSENLKVPTEIYSRVCGFFRPVNQWNPGKQEEYKDRKEYKVQ